MGTQQEETTTLEGIDSSLAELLKISEGADIVKALEGVDTTGHTDERGHVEGSLAGEGDAGVLDSMMIGKMRDSMIASGVPADAIAAFMAKMEGDDDDDDDDAGGGQPAGQPFGKFGKPASTEGGIQPNPRVRATGGEGGGKVDKSLDAFRGNETLAKAMNVAPFLEELVASVSEQIDGLAKSGRATRSQLSKSMNEKAARDAQVQISMAKALMEVGKLVKSVVAVNQELGRRLGIVERTPLPAKGQQNLGRGAGNPLAKSGDGSGEPKLSAAQAVRVLSYCGLEKSDTRWGQIGGQSASEISSFVEGGGQLTKSHVAHVLGFLAANPAERETALNYR
jgi:hypothetical protein